MNNISFVKVIHIKLVSLSFSVLAALVSSCDYDYRDVNPFSPNSNPSFSKIGFYIDGVMYHQTTRVYYSGSNAPWCKTIMNDEESLLIAACILPAYDIPRCGGRYLMKCWDGPDGYPVGIGCYFWLCFPFQDVNKGVEMEYDELISEVEVQYGETDDYPGYFRVGVPLKNVKICYNSIETPIRGSFSAELVLDFLEDPVTIRLENGVFYLTDKDDQKLKYEHWSNRDVTVFSF